MAAAILCAMASTGTGIAKAAAVADFYRGKKVSIYIGFPPGGGYDAYARAVAQYLGNHIPGKPRVIPRNMPGASGLIVANFIYNKAPKNGTALGVFTSGALFSPMFGNKKAKFDPAKFSWIGNVDQSQGACAVWHESGLKTFRDADGIWAQYRVEDVATPDAFRRDPENVQNFYNMRRAKLMSGEIEPNVAHQAPNFVA